MSKERFKITPFSAIILRQNNKVLLMKRASSAISGGFYAFPGGGIDGKGEPIVMEPHKCDGVAWFDINALPETLMPTHKHVVNLINKDIAFSEFGWE